MAVKKPPKLYPERYQHPDWVRHGLAYYTAAGAHPSPEWEARFGFIVRDESGREVHRYVPTPKGLDYHESEILNVIIEGPRGTGKSTIIRNDFHMRALSYPGFSYLIVRRTMPELKKSHLKANLLPREMLAFGGTYHKTDYIATYPNESTGFYTHCYDEQTEVLTERGFVFFKDLQPTDKIASLDTDYKTLRYDYPLALQRRPHEGKAIRYQSRSVDLLVTPEHKMLCWDWRGHTQTFRADEAAVQPRRRRPLRFKRTAQWKGRKRATYRILDQAVRMDDWLYFLGWFISEGHTTESVLNGYTVRRVSLAQKKDPEVINRVQALWSSWGFKSSVVERTDGVRVLSGASPLYPVLASLGKSHEKYVPDYVKQLPIRQLRLFLKSLFDGDGTCKNGKWIAYTTTSKRLADDVQELLLKVGMVGTLTTRNTTPAHKKPVYAVIVTHSRIDPCFEPDQVSEEDYMGFVYDVTMPTTPTLLVRRHGRIVWGHNCETEEDMMKLLSSEYHAIAFDEITTFTQEMITKIGSCLRVTEGSGITAFIRGGTNPLGVGADYVRRCWITKDIEPEEEPDYNPDDYLAIKTGMDDNPYIDKEQYIKQLAKLPDHVRRAWMDGEWVVEGAYFHDFAPSKVVDGQRIAWHVNDAYPMLKSSRMVGAHRPESLNWVKIYRSVDWGFSPDPAVCLWIAVLPIGRSFVIKEQTWRAKTAAHVAKCIKAESEGMFIVETFCDPTMFYGSEATNNNSVGDIFEANGVGLTGVKNDRVSAGYAIHEMLNTTLSDGLPQLVIYRDRCQMLTKTLPEMRTDKNDPKKIADHPRDHWTIALAYYCMQHTGVSKETAEHLTPRWMRPQRGAIPRLGSESIRIAR